MLCGNSVDIHGIWYEVIRALLRLKIFDFDLNHNWEVGSTLAVVLPTSTIVPTLPPYLGKSDGNLDDHWAESKLKIIDTEINVNSREAVRILVDFFEGRLARWDSDNVTLINKVKYHKCIGGIYGGHLCY